LAESQLSENWFSYTGESELLAKKSPIGPFAGGGTCCICALPAAHAANTNTPACIHARILVLAFFSSARFGIAFPAARPFVRAPQSVGAQVSAQAAPA
jgi:hypothetical protein